MTDNNRDERRTDLPFDQIAGDDTINDQMDNDLAEDLLEDPEVNGEGNGRLAEYDEETAAEVTPNVNDARTPAENRNNRAEALTGEDEGYEEQMENIETMEEAEEGGTALGWTALVLSIVSLFFLPVLTATAGIVTGFFAYRGGARTLGLWAIGVGLFSLVVALFFTPFLVR
ncbi:hypothetical protein GCM10010965_01710 [Caldalkalibacillus thermarum]|uniref:efflux RND transporter permease subunit n=1 Tax=Caldalkalibacillus thermarum TaxID=296745 RepID=UPI0016681591|nr:efflux RND transporter permease subunit [Caldalkalibacillus thermarum]GGK12335.1 hypothetical protein GCM10010965_01710 [Caldalkalibacillus thermarum]